MRIYVAGHGGMAGSAFVRALGARGVPVLTRTRADLDLTDGEATRAFLRETRPDAVIVTAAKVGGIAANAAYPADFIAENLRIETNLVQGAHEAGIDRLLFLGSSCIYPRNARQPIREEALLTGPLEPTNAPYAIAKIAGIALCEAYHRQHGRDYRAVMPANLYGPGDNFHPENAHVLPALMRRFHEAVASRAESVTIWGSGEPRREFLHVDDMAAGALHAFDTPRETWDAVLRGGAHVNLGTGEDVAIAELAGRIAGLTGFDGRVEFDPSRPDGTPRKVMDVSRMETLGWRSRIDLDEGLATTYRWFRAQDGRVRES